jgi:hypothetical protein
MMGTSHQPIRLAKDQPILQKRRRTSRRATSTDLETLERNFWHFFDLEKFAADWRRGVGTRSAA